MTRFTRDGQDLNAVTAPAAVTMTNISAEELVILDSKWIPVSEAKVQ